MDLKLSENHLATLKRTTQLYGLVKELILLSEELAVGNRTIIQPINELRHAFDHLMRVFAVIFEFDSVDGDRDAYFTKSLDKVLGHVYRSCYDSLDWISINMRQKVVAEVEEFSTGTLQAVMPEYYLEIRPFIEEAHQKIAKLRTEKDVADINYEDIREYHEIVQKLGQHYKQILIKKPALIEYKNKHGKEQWINRGVGVVMALFALLLFNYLRSKGWV